MKTPVNETKPIFNINSDRTNKNKIYSLQTKVRKRSNKPFKSKNLINTVSGLTVNPNSGKIAYTFYEDDSVVDCFQCVEP